MMGGKQVSLKPDWIDRLLAAAAVLLLIAALAALWRGLAQWGTLPAMVWAHLATVLLAVVLTPVMLLRRRGDRLHRWLGRVWVGAMALTALASFGVRGINAGHFSPIHLLSLLTLATLPRIVITARRKNIAKHRLAIRTTVAGALLIAGLFTFVPGRILGDWLYGG